MFIFLVCVTDIYLMLAVLYSRNMLLCIIVIDSYNRPVWLCLV
jgi:hypothetical protein